MSRQGASRLLAAAGIVLAAVAGGALLPGSSPVQAASLVLGGPVGQTAPVTVDLPTAPPSSTTQPSPLSVANTVPAQVVTETSTPATATAAPAIAAIRPAPAQHLTVPTIGIDVDILPVDNYPTGQLNAWGGEIFTPIDFPVDDYARQWVRRGNPNSLPAGDSADNEKAFDRTFLYGHASDIGNHLIFQDLAALRVGDKAIVDTKRGRFTYQVTAVLTSEKVDLDNFAKLYDYPADGAKELALVACLPDTTSNVVVLATLVDAEPQR